MHAKTSSILFIENHLSGLYLDESFSENLFSMKHNLYRCEFGKALGWAGVKTHALSWLRFFKITNISINNIINDADGIIACDYTETIQQRAAFKTIEADPSKTIEINCSLALGIERKRITHYCLTKNIPQLTLKLVNEDQGRYNQVANTPIFSHPCELHINIIIEHFKQNEILITKSQVQYLCAYFIGARDAEARDLFGMPSLSDDVSEQDILQLFKESSWEGVHKKICNLHLAEMMVEGFTLINS